MKTKKIVKAVCLTLVGIVVIVAAVFGFMFRHEAKTLLSIKADEEKGIYEVNYTSDYKLDELLEQGGAQTEDQLAQYIIKTMLKGVPVNIPYDVPQLACSTFVAEKPEGGFIFGRNLDNQATDLAVIKTNPKDGYSSVSVCNLSFLGYNDKIKPIKLTDKVKMLAVPYFPLDGVNEKGLAVGVLQLQAPATHQDHGKTDVDTTLAIRILLDNAANVREAVALLKTFDMHASANGCYHLQLADASGDSVVVSYVDGEMVVTEKKDKILACTNFYLHDVPFDYEKQGMDRYEKLIERLTEKKAVLTAEEGMELLNYVSIIKTKPDKEGRVYSTQWSSIYNLDEPSLNLCVDRNYDNVLTYSVK